jgi:integrase
MTSFRSSKVQAKHAVSQKLAIGEARHGNRDDGLIHSIGTARAYGEALSTFTQWLQDERLGDLRGAGRDVALRYLELRTTEVGQAQLNKDRQAIQSHLGERLPVLKSEVEAIRGSRLYTAEQLAMVREHQSERHGHVLATAIVEATGIRSHELLTLRLATDFPRSGHREWRPDLHAAMEKLHGENYRCYVVTGKGGLSRHVYMSKFLSDKLQSTFLASSPRVVIDRGVRYVSHYAIGGGHAWSQSFSAASKRALGWSAGGHAIRATWACARVEQLQAAGYCLDDAKAITSQNLGHFSPATLEYYIGQR